MRILLINTPYLSVYGKLNVGHNYTFPLGLGYIAAVLRQAGHTVFFLDPEPLGMGFEKIGKYIAEKKPSLIGLTTATPNFKCAVQIADLCRLHASQAQIVLGGIHASARKEKILENYTQFDVLVVGEGEVTILELCSAIESGGAFKDIAGIIYRNQNGEICITSPRPFLRNVDSLPMPARDLVDLNQYRLQVHLDIGVKSATLLTSRGCPFQCTFCASHLTMGRGFRPHSPAYVLKEIKTLVEQYGVKLISIVDDTFTVDKKRVRAICSLLLEHRIKVKWFCFARVDTIDKELLKLMKRAGCISLLFGVESADETVLQNIKKKIKPDQARRALAISNQLGFKTLASFMFGNPGDNKLTMKKTIDFAIEISPTIASFNRLVPYPGTEIYDKYFDADSEPDWGNFVPKGENIVISDHNLTKENLQNYTIEAFIRFYLRPGQILRILRNIRSFSELKVYTRGAYGLLRQILVWRCKSKQ